MAAPLNRRLLTLDDWCALPEDSEGRTELAQGVLMMSPRPRPVHSRAILRMASQLNDQMPLDLEALQEVEVILDSGPRPTVRAPDITVSRAVEDAPRFDADDILIAIEFLSPGSRRLDMTVKRHEYETAQIPHYWIVDLEESSLTALRLVDGRYLGETSRGEFTCSDPFAFHADLAALGTRRRPAPDVPPAG